MQEERGNFHKTHFKTLWTSCRNTLYGSAQANYPHAFSNVVRYAQDQNEAGNGYEEVDPNPVVKGFDKGPNVILILQVQRGDNGVGSRGYQGGEVNILGLVPGPKERAWKTSYALDTRYINFITGEVWGIKLFYTDVWYTPRPMSISDLFTMPIIPSHSQYVSLNRNSYGS